MNKNTPGSFITDTVYYHDTMTNEVRLARIARLQNDNESFKKHMALAKEACSQRKWPDCSEENMISYTKRLEIKNPIACFKNEKP